MVNLGQLPNTTILFSLCFKLASLFIILFVSWFGLKYENSAVQKISRM